MAPILGKRRRRDDYTATSLISPIEPSSKRQALLKINNDENALPVFDFNTKDDATYCNELEFDELDDSFSVPFKSPLHRATSLGQIAYTQGVASPRVKINAHFKSTKHTTREPVEKSYPLTPKTPRYRDALSKKIPITPRHRASVTQRPATPRTPLTPSNTPTIYNAARQLFVRSADPGRLIGREKERSELEEFMQTHITSNSGGCVYVSGPPGTGKSALVGEICDGLKKLDDVRTAYINCMSVKGSTDIYSTLIEELCNSEQELVANQTKVLKALFFPADKASSRVYVVVLDEIDHLLSLDLEILYTLFEWSLNRSSRLIVVGIANALDLTDRFLPRLKTRSLRPQLLPFLPYTVPQIASVITTKLKSLLPRDAAPSDYVPFVHPAAIQLCSKKVASQTGDLRKAFDIIRRAVDLVEKETRQKHQENLEVQILQDSPSKTPLAENMNLSSPCLPSGYAKKSPSKLAESLSMLNPQNAPRASIAHVARVTASAFNHGTLQRLLSLNLQQKAALCSLVALEKKNTQSKRDLFATPSKSANATPTIRRVYQMYCELCKRDNTLHALTATEFGDVIGSLTTLTLVQEGDAKGFSGLGLARLTPSKKMSLAEDKRIVSCVTEKEVEGCLDGPGGGILKGFLHEENN